MLFEKNSFLRNLSRRKVFISKANALYFFSKIWHVVKLSKQNRMRCENFLSKSDALENFNSKSDKF